MTPAPDDIEVRPAATVADFHACQRAQRDAWGIQDDSYIVPIATLVGAQHHGGLVLGAFLPDGRAVGLSFAFLGRVDGRLCLYSQLTGVVPGYQDRGLGARMKEAQRTFAREQHVPCIAWAFDPLQAGNARFNLDKLGAACRRYVVDMYGPRTDALNRDTPTDRLIAVWEVEPPPTPPTPPDPARLDALARVVGSHIDADGARVPATRPRPDDAAEILIEIPRDVNRLRAERPEAARLWGLAVREAFLDAFAAGFVADGFLRDDERAAYVLRRSP